MNEEVQPPTITVGINGKNSTANLPAGSEKTTHIFTNYDTYQSVLASIPDGVEFDFAIYCAGIYNADTELPTIAFGMTGKRGNYGSGASSLILGSGYGIVYVNNDWRYALFPYGTFDDETKTIRFTYRYSGLFNSSEPAILSTTISLEDISFYNLVRGYVAY